MTTTKASEFLISGAGGGAKLWVNGEDVTQWDYRKSLLDGEIYQRKTATGGGTTDPANDTTNYKAASYKRVLSIQNAAATGVRFNNPNFPAGFANLRQTAPALSSGVRTNILSITGRGTLNTAAFYIASTLPGNLRAELIIDGRPAVLDATFTIVNTNSGAFLAGAVTNVPANGAFETAGDAIEFKRSVQIWATSVGGTTLDQLVWGYRYTLES